MKVYFYEKLRNQIKFKDESDLITQMNHDSDNAKNMLKAKYGL